MPQFSKWVACWGNATSITEQKESTYTKNLTLRYPVRVCFNGNKFRFHFSNLTGTENVKIDSCFVAKQSETYNPLPVTYLNKKEFVIEPGKEICTDELLLDVSAGEIVEISFYLKDYTQLNSGTLITGPLSSGKYSYGNFADQKTLPIDKTRSTNWFYFLNTIDIYTEEKNHALICFGDSITAQSWPDYLSLRAWDLGCKNVSVIRRAVSGTRILRQYDCITYAAYGLKGSVRFPIEMNVAGASAVIIQHGINDIIHPVGVEVNPFRPWSDMPAAKEMELAVEEIYVNHAKKLGLKVYSGTLLPIFGWRTYNEKRDAVRNEFNEWLRTSEIFAGCIDFDKALRSSRNPATFAEGFDSGDHLHPSEKAYEKMASVVPVELLK